MTKKKCFNQNLFLSWLIKHCGSLIHNRIATDREFNHTESKSCRGKRKKKGKSKDTNKL